MGGRKICFEGDDGQYGTCIRDDEDCMKCDPVSREQHYKMVAKYDKGTKKVSSEEHASNLSKICDEMHILKQITYGLREMSSATSVVGLDKLSDDLAWRANTIEGVVEETLILLRKHQHEELMIATHETEQLKKILKK